MTNCTPLSVTLLLLTGGALAGCSSTPSTPSVVPPAGTVELTTNRPDGATLVVNPCRGEEGDVFPCTHDLQMTFSVVLNRDIDRAVVSTQFYTTSGHLCAAGNTQIVAVTAGRPVTLTASSVFVSLQGSSTPPECGLPVQTTRMVAHLLQDGDPAVGDLLTQEFANTYTFAGP